MTRTQNIKKNLIFNIIKYVTQLVLQFVLRTILIHYMGKEYLGLNGLFSNIFSFLNLAELGIGSAIVFSMYKPIAENNVEKIKTLQSLYKKFYFIIFCIILIIGGALTPIIKIFIKDDVNVPANINIYLLYIMYLINTLCGYFSAHKRSLLFAYQRNDIENKIKTICLIGMNILQILIIILLRNYYIFFAINIVFTLFENLLILIVANKHYPEINGKSEPLDKETRKEISKNITALSMHKVGSAIVFSTDNILISAFCGITILGVYSNYYLITSSIILIFSLFINSLSGSVGNLVATQDVEYTYNKYKQINFCFTFLSAFTTICLFVLFQPFILLWTNDSSYLLDFSTVILIVLSFYLNQMRSSVGIFKNASGLFWQDRWKPIVEAIVNLIISIVLAYFIGINGIFIGTIVSTIVAPFWVEPFILYKHYFKKSVKEYFLRYTLDFIIMIASCAICYIVCLFIPDSGIWWLVLKFAVCIILGIVLLLLAYLPFKDFRELLFVTKNLIKSMFKKDKIQ